jgi:D-3-phosphoglycerate dehydrogenase
MKPFILVSDGMDAKAFATLSQNTNLEVYPEKKVSQDKVKELLPKLQAIVIRSATKMTKEYIDRAPNLKLIIRAGEGTDNIDKAYCQVKGITVENTPGANNNSAAEHAFALMMTALRKTAFAHQKMKDGGWHKELFTGNELWKKTIGIVGFGRIGQILAKRLQGFEPNVLFYDPHVQVSDLPYATKVDEVEDIFKRSDIVSIHVPLMEQTRGLVNQNLLGLMPEHAVLVNAARGGIVNEEDLFNHLKEQKIKAAAFDVFASEPLEENSPLRQLDNLILTPHLGASTEEAQIRVGAMAVDQLLAFFGEDKIINAVKA